MKQNYLQIILLLIVIGLSGCQHKAIDDQFRWTPTEPEADRLLISMDSAWSSGEPADIFDVRLAHYDSLTRKRGTSVQARGRYYYWLARTGTVRESPETQILQYDSIARSLMDSASYPYDHARLNSIKHSVYSPDFVDRYSRLLAAKRYAERSGDSLLCAEAMMVISEYGYINGNRDESLAMLHDAHRIYTNLGLKHRADVASLNILLVDGDSAKLVEGLSKLVAESRKRGSDSLKPTTNDLMISSLTNDIDELKRLNSLPEASTGMRAWANQSLVSAYRLHGDKLHADSAIKAGVPLLRQTLKEGRESGDRRYFSIVYTGYLANMNRLAENGLPDSALFYLKEAMAIDNEYRDSYGITQSRDVTKAWMQEALYRQQETASKQRVIMILTLGVIVLLLAGTVVATWLTMQKRVQSVKLKKQEAELERERYRVNLEKDRRQLVSSALAMTEKDNVFQSILEDIEKLEKDGKLSSPDARQLDSSIRMHLSSRQDWENFRVTFDKVHPAFLKNMRERYPRLTEGDLQMAVYVKIGLSNKQISRMLMLAPGSVKLKRHRLREHMEIAAEDSLEDTLRNID